MSTGMEPRHRGEPAEMVGFDLLVHLGIMAPAVVEGQHRSDRD